MQIQKQDIQQTLKSSYLNFDIDTIQQTTNFIEQHLPIVPIHKKNYHIYAAAAIVSQMKRVPSVDGKSMVSGGIVIQKVLGHLPNLSKQQFLEILTYQCNHFMSNSPVLKIKINQVKLAYRIYKKYRSIFQTLSTQLKLVTSSKIQLQSIFWIAYLFLKNRSQQSDNIQHNTLLILVIFKSVFQFLIATLNANYIDEIFYNTFQIQFSLDSLAFNSYHDFLQKMVQQMYYLRTGLNQINWTKLIANPSQLHRMADDLSIQYDAFQNNLKEEQKPIVNQITFLELDKTITPMSIRYLPQNKMTAIADQLDFSNDDYDLNLESTNLSEEDKKDMFLGNFFQELEEPERNTLADFSPFFDYQTNETPIEKKINSLKWLRDCLGKVTAHEVTLISIIYQKFLKEPYDSFQWIAQQGIVVAVQKFCWGCQDTVSRRAEVYKLFIYFVWVIAHHHTEQESQKMFSKEKIFRAVLCLSAQLFNYAYHSIEGEYVEYCKIFRVEIIDILKPINWLAKYIAPISIQLYMYNIEKKILIKDIWETDMGFNILTSKDQIYVESIAKRLYEHISDRIIELSRQLRIQSQIVSKIHNLVDFICKKRVYILKNNRIDHIIICSTAIMLKLNDSLQKRKSIEEVFQVYRSILYASNANRDNLCDPNDNVLTLSQFYRVVFAFKLKIILKQIKTGLLQIDILTHTVENSLLILQQVTQRSLHQSSVREGQPPKYLLVPDSSQGQRPTDYRREQKIIQNRLMNQLLQEQRHPKTNQNQNSQKCSKKVFP